MYSLAAVTAGRPLCTLSWIGLSPINHSWHQKTRDTVLPNDEDRILLHSLVLTQYRSVTDRQTDRRICRSIYSTCKTSFEVRFKNTKITHTSDWCDDVRTDRKWHIWQFALLTWRRAPENLSLGGIQLLLAPGCNTHTVSQKIPTLNSL